MNCVFKYLLLINLVVIGQATLLSQANQDYFKIHAGALPVTIYVGNAGKPGSLLGVDGQKGIIYAQMEGAGRMQLELRGLDKQNIKGFAMAWPADAMKTLKSFSNEQYNAQLIPSLRPIMYKAMLCLEIPQQYFAIHDNCLVYVKALIAMEQYNEAFYLLSRINLNKLDGFGYRDFSEAALDLVGRMIRANPKSAKVARALLQRITIRDNSADHLSKKTQEAHMHRSLIYGLFIVTSSFTKPTPKPPLRTLATGTTQARHLMRLCSLSKNWMKILLPVKPTNIPCTN
jgi:hypothetical protein